jgi:hypothetical protein
MNQVLSQSEVDALLNAVSAGNVDVDGQGAGGAGGAAGAPTVPVGAAFALNSA